MATFNKDRMLEFRGEDLHDRDGGKIGTIEEIYLDAASSEPEWALVHTGLFGSKRTFVPLRGARQSVGEHIRPDSPEWARLAAGAWRSTRTRSCW